MLAGRCCLCCGNGLSARNQTCFVSESDFLPFTGVSREGER